MHEPVFSFEGPCDVKIAAGDTEPFHEGCRFEIKRTSQRLVLRLNGREHHAEEKSETHVQCVDNESRWSLWLKERDKGAWILGAVLRKDRGEDATGVWIAESGQRVEPDA